MTENEINIIRAWRQGHIHVAECNEKTLAYCCKHISKGLSYGRIPIRYPGGWFVHPEFVRMSRRPGIGVDAIGHLCGWITSKQGVEFIAKNARLPTSIRFGTRYYSIGRTLSNHLKAAAGISDSEQWTIDSFRRLKVIQRERNEILGGYLSEHRRNSGLKAKFIIDRQKSRSKL